MSLPQHLENYEFQRKLVLSTDVDRFYHLKVERKPDGTPICTASGKAEFTPMNVKEILGQVGPLEIEIGCGKGNFLADYCTQNPNTSFIGIDPEPSIAHIAAKRVLKLRKQGML